MTNEQVNRIEDYLEGRMNPEEQKRFEQDLISDQELATAYDTYRAVEKYMFNPKQYAQEDDVKNTLTELGAEFFGAAPATTGDLAAHAMQTADPETGLRGAPARANGRMRRMRNAVMAAAVVLAVLLISSWYYWWNDRSDLQRQITANPSATSDTTGSQPFRHDTASTTPATPVAHGMGKKNITENRKRERANSNRRQQLFAAYFQHDTLPADREALLKAGFELYEKKRYKQAADALEDAGLELSTRGEQTGRTVARFYAAYYQALSYMATNKDTRAIALLKGLTAPSAPLQAKTDWYLSLCYIRTNRLPEAMPLLRKVGNNEEAGTYKAAADRLMAKLKK